MAAGAGYTKVGPYILMDTIGVGSFGKVKVCVHHHTLYRYACKIIEKSLIRDSLAERSQQVQREIAIMSRLRHANTVSLVSVHSTASKVFIIMELVTGGELCDEIMRLKRFPEPYARFYFRQLIQGLQYCHAHGVYHRDLKPDNLLLDQNRTLKITDFGLATLKAGPATDGTDSVTGSLLLHTQCGTPNYVAPEIINIDPNGYSGSKVDAWACGIILYVLVGGALPFDSGNLEVLFKDIVRCDLNYPPFFSESLKDLINNLLKTNPKDRYSLGDVVQHPWYNESVVGMDWVKSLPPLVPRFRIGPNPKIFSANSSPQGRESQEFNHSQNGLPELDKILSHEKSQGAKDNLDFGIRVESADSELAFSSLPIALQQVESVRFTSYGSTSETNVSANGEVHDPTVEHSEPDFRYEDDPVFPGNSQGIADRSATTEEDTEHSATIEEVTDHSATNEEIANHSAINEEIADHSATSELSKFGPDKDWVLSDTDRLVWCRMMKDFDMIPDTLEFGVDSATLSEMWEHGLASEKLHRKSSFAADRFGLPRNRRSRSAQYLFSAALRSEAEAWQGSYKKEYYGQGQKLAFSEQAGSASRESVTTAEEIAKGEEQPSGDASSGASPREAVGPVSMAPLPIDKTRNEEDVHYELFGDCTYINSSFPQSRDEHVPSGHPSSSLDHSSNYPELPPSIQKMGEGQDLLQENDSRAVTESRALTESSRHPRSGQDLEAPMPSKSDSLGIANSLKQNRNLGTKVASALSNTGAAVPRGNSAASYIGQYNENQALSPFALDVPGPRRARPVTKTILGAIVPSTMSPRRLLRKSSTPLDIRSFTQFHSLLEPSTCFELIQSVLREYGCSILKATSARSRDKFRIRCESIREDRTVHARVSIFKVDDVLCAVHMKRLHNTDVKHFTRFYADVSRLYSENLKQRGLFEDSARRRSKRGPRVRFENGCSIDTADDHGV